MIKCTPLKWTLGLCLLASCMKSQNMSDNNLATKGDRSDGKTCSIYKVIPGKLVPVYRGPDESNIVKYKSIGSREEDPVFLTIHGTPENGFHKFTASSNSTFGSDLEKAYNQYWTKIDSSKMECSTEVALNWEYFREKLPKTAKLQSGVIQNSRFYGANFKNADEYLCSGSFEVEGSGKKFSDFWIYGRVGHPSYPEMAGKNTSVYLKYKNYGHPETSYEGVMGFSALSTQVQSKDGSTKTSNAYFWSLKRQDDRSKSLYVSFELLPGAYRSYLTSNQNLPLFLGDYFNKKRLKLKFVSGHCLTKGVNMVQSNKSLKPLTGDDAIFCTSMAAKVQHKALYGYELRAKLGSFNAIRTEPKPQLSVYSIANGIDKKEELFRGELDSRFEIKMPSTQKTFFIFNRIPKVQFDVIKSSSGVNGEAYLEHIINDNKIRNPSDAINRTRLFCQ